MKDKCGAFKFHLVFARWSLEEDENAEPSTLTPYSTVPLLPRVIACQNSFSKYADGRHPDKQYLLAVALFAMTSKSRRL